MTNNMAEYTALLIGLKEAQRAGAEEVTIRSDSELIVKQLDGRYRVKNETLKILHLNLDQDTFGVHQVTTPVCYIERKSLVTAAA